MGGSLALCPPPPPVPANPRTSLTPPPPLHTPTIAQAHPVLAHYEFLLHSPNSNGVYGVRWVGDSVQIGSMWTAD